MFWTIQGQIHLDEYMWEMESRETVGLLFFSDSRTLDSSSSVSGLPKGFSIKAGGGILLISSKLKDKLWPGTSKHSIQPGASPKVLLSAPKTPELIIDLHLKTWTLPKHDGRRTSHLVNWWVTVWSSSRSPQGKFQVSKRLRYDKTHC